MAVPAAINRLGGLVGTRLPPLGASGGDDLLGRLGKHRLDGGHHVGIVAKFGRVAWQLAGGNDLATLVVIILDFLQVAPANRLVAR